MLNRFLTYLAYLCIRGLLATCRLRYSGVENIRKAEAKLGGYVIAMWHEHGVSGPLGHVNQPVGLLISISRDGDNLTYLCEKLGLVTLRGSSSKRGKEARVELKQLIRKGVPIALAIDGPKGPRHSCKPGAILMARDIGCAILPIVAIPEWRYEFNSWDKMKLPLPFTRLIIHHGEPLYVPKDIHGADFEQYQEKLRLHLLETLNKGEKQFAHWSKIPKGPPRPRSKPTLLQRLTGS